MNTDSSNGSFDTVLKLLGNCLEHSRNSVIILHSLIFILMTDFTSRHNREINSHFIQKENAFYTLYTCLSLCGQQERWSE